jgi:mannosylglycerate hydrolase
MHIHLVSHTHWDREWYQPYQQFRIRLIHLLDNLLELFESDLEFKHFMLDGQTIILDDYLEIRPEKEPLLCSFVQSGRMLIGPWHILPDEFLVSPEATIRNLLEGDRTARRFGRKMMVGYIPDPFGHIAQMPQILLGFGLEAACVQRGLSDEPAEFWWQGPDGSRVFMAYLRDGYGNAVGLPASHPERFTAEIERLAKSLLPYSAASLAGQPEHAQILLMHGTDHTEPPPETTSAIAYASRILKKDTVRHSTLQEYVSTELAYVRENNLQIPTVTGELRSSRRYHLLPGVLSTRMWIKQRNHTCENLLEKWAEPFSAWAAIAFPRSDRRDWSQAGPLQPVRVSRPAPLLKRAWRLLMECHPHDSICGCSVDQVHEEMRPRFDQVEQIGEEVTRQSLEALANRADTRPPRWPAAEEAPIGALVVFNPLSGPRTDWAAFSFQLPPGVEHFEVVDQNGEALPQYVVMASSHELINITLDRTGLLSSLGAIQEGRVENMSIRWVGFRRDDDQAFISASLAEGTEPDIHTWENAVQQMQSYLDDPSVKTFTIKARTVIEAFAVISAKNVPGYGYRTFWLRPASPTGEHPPGRNGTASHVLPMAVKMLPSSSLPIDGDEGKDEKVRRTVKENANISNDHLEVRFSSKTATFEVVDKKNGAHYPGLNRFVDGGDCGDEYNYCPPRKDRLIRQAKVIGIRVFERPPQKSIEVDLMLQVPARLSNSRAERGEELVDLPLKTIATLIEGVPRLDIHTIVTNHASDHRLRVHFPAPFSAGEAEHDGHFAIIRRGVGLPTFDDSWIEEPRPEVPQRAFTRIANSPLSMTVANRGLPEVEVLEDETGLAEIALTLLRSVGWLSRDDFHNRKGHAGPKLATPGAQEPGTHTYDYAFIPGRSSEVLADYKQAYAFNVPLRAAATGIHEGVLSAQASLVEVSSLSFEISTIKINDSSEDSLIVRGYNLDSRPIEVQLKPWRPFKQAVQVSLAEEDITELKIDPDGGVSLPAGGCEIVTVCFSDDSEQTGFNHLPKGGNH